MRDVTNNSVVSGPVYTESELMAIPEIREMFLEDCRRRALRLKVALWGGVASLLVLCVVAVKVWG
ncbi:hypothetical protein K6V72_00135 [Ralstonia insidiosa]|jgi:hypothetical protein|uniref:Uncharacterized protein n=1 Tax=Ralstonia insidiosa TaxID=190721 RepID=A0A191ZWH4_9RALS|nr:hypothetical protein [Ralstonia insidiosa]ANJ72433.1 hypothetical protein A9Y76_08100 [Ralstonia insidiosa]KAB0472976.1 hypothetical protein F7R11_10645 [Ralstonia insidiosa]MBY4907389.1 hypothetical protein [Ralstonia insidiosa]